MSNESIPGKHTAMFPCEKEVDLRLLTHRLEQLEERHDEQAAQIKQLLKYADVIDNIVEEQRARRKFWETTSAQVASAGLWAIIVALGSALWFTLQSKIGKP